MLLKGGVQVRRRKQAIVAFARQLLIDIWKWKLRDQQAPLVKPLCWPFGRLGALVLQLDKRRRMFLWRLVLLPAS